MSYEQYSVEERIFMVLEYEKTTNYAEVQWRFRARFQTSDAPSNHMMKRHYENFVATGSVKDHYSGHVGGETMTVTDKNIQKVKDYSEENPKSSIRQAAAVLNLSYYAVHKILTKKIEFYPYKVTFY